MNKVRLIQLRLALAAGALMLLSPGRIGAQAPPSTQASSPQPSPIASPTPTAPPALGTAEAERVVVTAEKREQNIQEVPSSISVINDVELDNLHATQLTGLRALHPGFSGEFGRNPGQTVNLLAWARGNLERGDVSPRTSTKHRWARVDFTRGRR